MAPHRTPYVRRAMFLSLLLASLAACTDEENNKQALNAPYAADPLDAPLHTASLPALQRRGIFIQLPSGLPNELASLLLARLQEASLANRLPLAKTGTIPEVTVKGVARAGIAPNGTAVALVWEVVGADGKRLKLLSGDALIQRPEASPLDRFDPWATVDAKTLESIADQAAQELAGWYQADFLAPAESNIATASLTPAVDAQNIPPMPPASPPIDFSTPSLLAIPGGVSEDTSARDATLLDDLAPTRRATASSSPPASITSLADAPSPASAITATISRPTSPPAGPSAEPSIVTASLGAATQPAINTRGTPPRALFDVAVGTSPGDGQLSLAAAVQEALLNMPGSPATPAAYRVLGEVTLSKAEAGKAHVTIEWTIASKEGVPLGLVSQSNIVGAEEIAGTWGQVATEAGTAAARGILELISPSSPKA